MFNYAELQNIARQLLLEFDGRTTPIKIVRHTGGKVSETTGAWVDGTDFTADLTGVVIGYNDSQVDGVKIMTGDLSVIITDQVKPEYGDAVIIDGISYAIVNINPVNIGGTPIIYKLQVRR